MILFIIQTHCLFKSGKKSCIKTEWQKKIEIINVGSLLKCVTRAIRCGLTFDFLTTTYVLNSPPLDVCMYFINNSMLEKATTF